MEALLALLPIVAILLICSSFFTFIRIIKVMGQEDQDKFLILKVGDGALSIILKMSAAIMLFHFWE